MLYLGNKQIFLRKCVTHSACDFVGDLSKSGVLTENATTWQD